MAHVLTPKPSDSKMPVFINVDTSVGRNGDNSNREDILLVQFMLKALTNNMTTPKGKIIKPILLETPQTGIVDRATILSIELFQRAIGHPVDGRISSARGYSYGIRWFTIAELNVKVRADFRQAFPRLDQIPGCPGELRNLINRIM